MAINKKQHYFRMHVVVCVGVLVDVTTVVYICWLLAVGRLRTQSLVSYIVLRP